MDPSLAEDERWWCDGSEFTTDEGLGIFHGERARILRRERRICIVLEMGHLLGTMVEKAERLLLE
jgi:hypothetical protein